jgi:hemerythrin superfamily protein
MSYSDAGALPIRPARQTQQHALGAQDHGARRHTPHRRGPTMATKKTTPKEATALLRADHQKVSKLFAQYEKSRSSNRKASLVAEICLELTVHATVEEEIFYPAVKRALKDKELVPEATVEHASLKALIAQIEGVAPDGEMYDAKVKVLSEYVKHHVKEEQGEMFKKARATSLDMKALGARMAERKAELMAQR